MTPSPTDTTERGFDKKYYLILALIREHGPVGRKDVDDALLC